MSQSVSLNHVWQSASKAEQVFQPEHFSNLPNAVQRYLQHAIAPDTPLASAVHLRMHGKIKLKTWSSFRAEQVIHWPKGMIWNATAWMNGLPIRGWDRLLDGAGAMQWKLLGLIPVMTATGPDITKSAIGRVQAECIWLPSVFCDRTVTTWTASNDHLAHAHLTLLGETTELVLKIGEQGQLQQIRLKRWGNPEGGTPRYLEFGGFIDQEDTFSGYTIPTKVRIGWYFGTDRFESEGEFFHATIEQAEFI